MWSHRNSSTGATSISLVLGGSFGPPYYGLAGHVAVMTDPNWKRYAVDDFNGDGRADLLWRNSATGQTAVWLMNGTTLVSGAGLLGPDWQISRTGDFNGDGRADILFTNTVSHDKVMWLMNGRFPSSGNLPSNDPNWSILQ